MIEQVEEVRPESQILPFAQLEGLAQSEIDILLRRPDDAVARRVAVDRRVAGSSVGKRAPEDQACTPRDSPSWLSAIWAAWLGALAQLKPGVESRR